jgi:hypothetical protein
VSLVSLVDLVDLVSLVDLVWRGLLFLVLYFGMVDSGLGFGAILRIPDIVSRSFCFGFSSVLYVL